MSGILTATYSIQDMYYFQGCTHGSAPRIVGSISWCGRILEIGRRTTTEYKAMQLNFKVLNRSGLMAR